MRASCVVSVGTDFRELGCLNRLAGAGQPGRHSVAVAVDLAQDCVSAGFSACDHAVDSFDVAEFRGKTLCQDDIEREARLIQEFVGLLLRLLVSAEPSIR